MTPRIASKANSSSSPSQHSSMISPHLTQAPRTLNTLFALAVLPLAPNVICDLNLIASLQKIPAGRRCSPEGFVILILSLTIYNLSLQFIPSLSSKFRTSKMLPLFKRHGNYFLLRIYFYFYRNLRCQRYLLTCRHLKVDRMGSRLQSCDIQTEFNF